MPLFMLVPQRAAFFDILKFSAWLTGTILITATTTTKNNYNNNKKKKK